MKQPETNSKSGQPKVVVAAKSGPNAKAEVKPKAKVVGPPKPIDMDGIYREIRTSLTRYVSRYFRRAQEAEDVVQEAFVKVIQAQRDREIQSPKSYIFRTARNISLAHISKSSYKLTDEVGDILTDSELLMTKTMEEQFEVRENFEVFCSAVRVLPVKCRRVFVLCRVYGFSQKEVALRMGITLSTVEGHLTRATRRCVDFMEAEQSGKHQRRSANHKEQ